jgi:hypothetical protein
VAWAVRIRDAVDRWWECWKELKKMEALANESTDMAEDLQVCKNRMLSELRNVADIARLDANDEERAQMPVQSRPELVLRWAQYEMKSLIRVQRARWGCMLWLMPPRTPHPPPWRIG